MNNIVLKLKDKVYEYEFSKCLIFTEKFEKKLSKNDIFVPLAAKLVLDIDSITKLFILEAPIIKVSSDGDVVVWSETEFKKSTLEKKFFKSIEDMVLDENLLALLVEKEKIGLTFDEVFKLQELRGKAALIKILNTKYKIKLTKGGI